MAIDDRQPANVLPHHVIGGIAQRRIEVDNRRCAPDQRTQRRVRVAIASGMPWPRIAFDP
jgi:hypothetical protein